MRRRSPYQHSDWPVLAALTVIAIALLTLHQRAGAGKRASPPERAARAVLQPLEETVAATWRGTAYAVGGLTRARQLAKQNEELRQANAELESKLVQRQWEHLDYQELRKAFGLEPTESPTEIRARVIGRSAGRFEQQTIDIVALGNRELRKQDIVLWAGYLVGRVESAQGGRAKVTLLLDPDSGVAALVKPSNAKGAVMGPDPGTRESGLLRLVHLDRNEHIAVGDKVFTSSIGLVYPPGIPIGVVQEVIGGAGPAEPKTALVRPYVAFGDLNYVTVLRPGG
jgi:rod shape-determining protein MreC